MLADCTDIVMLPSLTDCNIRRTGGNEGNGAGNITGIVIRLGDSGYVVGVCCEVKDCIISKRNKS